MEKGRISKKKYIIIIGICLVNIVGLRSIIMGQNDTLMVYKPFFERIIANDLSYALNLKDPGFQLITYLFTRCVGHNFQLYIYLLSVPYIWVVCLFIYKYSKKPVLSLLMFTSLQYFEISFTLIRQVNAMALLMLATYFLIKKKSVFAILFIVLAGFIHQTCLIFLVMIPLSEMVIKRKTMFAVSGISLLFLFFSENILSVIYKVLGTSHRFAIYADKGHQKTYVFYFLNLILWLGCLLTYKYGNETRERKIFFYSATVAMVISPLVVVLGEMSRIVYYFGIYEIILFPDVSNCFSRKSKRTFNFVCYFFMIIYFLLNLGPGSNVIPYIPYWT